MKTLIAGAVALGLMAGGCQTVQIADKAMSRAALTLNAHCNSLRYVALGAVAGSPEKQRAAFLKAAVVVESVCANPPADTAAAIRVVVDTLGAIDRMN